ncbi:MAG: tetratricopeptide repeat protein [Cyanobacteria bacterium REEB67]|nr:tetratricopeptide repeat protein [Cyanobacteria bacterium REEB67]
MLQPPATPRFQEDSALKKHWPLIWLSLLLLLTGLSLRSDFLSLGRLVERHPRQEIAFATSVMLPHSKQRFMHSYPVVINPLQSKAEDYNHGSFGSPGSRPQNVAMLNDGLTSARELLARGRYTPEPGNQIAYEGSVNFVQWVFHRKLAFYLLQQDDYDGARQEFENARRFALLLGPKTPCLAYSSSDLALFHELRALQMKQVAEWLLRVALPIYSFFAALLPFALFLHFLKSRDRDGIVAESGGAGMARMIIKTSLLASWFAVVVTGWAALRNYGMGLVVGAADPSVLACGGAITALFVSICMMVRYMPPYKSLSLKRTLVGFGFGGILVVIKSLTIYWALCLSLAGHPALKEALFSEHLFFEQISQAKYAAAQALQATAQTNSLTRAQKKQVSWWMDSILKRPAGEVEKYRLGNVAEVLNFYSRQSVPVAGLPYLWDADFHERFTPRPQYRGQRPNKISASEELKGISLGLTFKACFAYFLIFCPEMLAYILLGLRQRPQASKAFNSAATIKEYFFGIDHWLVISMLEMYGSCLLAVGGGADLRMVGEDYLRQAILRYERSRGRHDQLTIAAKMSLALIYSERGDDKQAEKILTEALRDVGKDFDIFAYCSLLSEIGRLYCKRNNYSRAKQMYKQVIDLLEQKINKTPSSKGLLGYFRNIYATIPYWQLELKLVAAYLDLAEVFYQAKYNGEAQRLTEDAGKLVSNFEDELCVIAERASLYVRARLAQASILNSHGRVDECFKLLAAAHRQLSKWGYARSFIGFEFCVGRAEIELVASRGQSNYCELARKNYLSARKIFGDCVTFPGRGLVIERWRKVGEKFGVRPDTLIFTSRQREGEFAQPWQSASVLGGASGADEVRRIASPLVSPSAVMARSALESAAYQNGTEAKSSKSSKPSSSLPLTAASTVISSKLIEEAQASPEEGIVLRWQREHQEEKIFT